MPKPDSLSNVLLTMFDLLLGCPEVHSGSACRGDSALAADNLFLRKQLALYLERHKAPCAWLSHRRADGDTSPGGGGWPSALGGFQEGRRCGCLGSERAGRRWG